MAPPSSLLPPVVWHGEKDAGADGMTGDERWRRSLPFFLASDENPQLHTVECRLMGKKGGGAKVHFAPHLSLLFVFI